MSGRRALSDLGGAREAMYEAERHALRHRLPALAASSVMACRVRLWLAEGNLDVAARWAQRSGLNADDQVSYVREPEHPAILPVLLAVGEPGLALALPDRLLRASEATARIGRVVGLLALQALARQARESIHRASAALHRSVFLARPEGYVWTFIDEGVPVVMLVRQAGAQGIAPQYVTQLLSDMAEGSGTTSSPMRALVKAPSEHELEVLRLLAAGKSNRNRE